MLSEYAVHHRVVIGFFVFLLVAGGIFTYFTIGRLEDPEFTVKTSVVVTPYPGASAREVEENVTDLVERTCRRLKNLRRLRSWSMPGLSLIYVDLDESVSSSEISENWTDLRNKLAEIRLKLPPEAVSPIVQDDFGQVYGIVLALTCEGFSPAEQLERAKFLQREFSLLSEVGRVELWGVPDEQIEIRISQAKMTQLSISPSAVLAALTTQNLMMDSGSMRFEGEDIRLTPSGKFQSIDEIGDLVIVSSTAQSFLSRIQGHSGELVPGAVSQGVLQKQNRRLGEGEIAGTSQQIRLRDIASIRRVEKDPSSKICRFDGKNSIAIAISPRPNGNVVKLGEEVRLCSKQVMGGFPAGCELSDITFQPQDVNEAVSLFIKNLREAVVIVAIVVMISMGWRSGILITSSLLIVILATMCVLEPMGIVLQRISLGAFIIALGILVDDAVVVGDLIIVRMQRGMERARACVEGAKRASWQLLGATVVGALAFLPIYLTPTNVGEYCSSLFLVVAVSLGISWFVAVLQTPVVYYLFVNVKQTEASVDPHGGPIYRAYRHLLAWALTHRVLVIGLIVLSCGVAAAEFRHVDQNFFPRARRTQFWIDFWFPGGTSIETVSNDIREAEAYLARCREEDCGITSFAAFIGSGPPRFYLPYEPEFPHQNYGHIVVNVEKVEDVDVLLEPVKLWMKNHFPQAQVRVQRFATGLPTPHEVEARFSGSDPRVLQQLAFQAEKILRESPFAQDIQNNWREKVLTLSPKYSQNKGQRAGLTRTNLEFSLLGATKGIQVGVFAENENNIPIVVRGMEKERNDIENAQNIQVWGPMPGSVPLGELVSDMEYVWEDAKIYRYDSRPAVVVGADAYGASWMTLIKDVREKIEGIELPEGYSFEWGGQFYESKKSTEEVLAWLPLACVLMLGIVVALFNDLRQPLIIVLTVPLAMIGITTGLLLLGKSFGFMALLGVMSLLGMIIRNGVVLMDQIDEELTKGGSRFEAVLDASVERMRPVVVAASTVVVGMIPLLRDPMFDAMATAMMFGLIFSTVLTLFVVPVLYSIFFRIRKGT